jgi:hypothetical protein
MPNYALFLVWPSQMRSDEAVTAQVLNTIAPLLPLLFSRLESVGSSDSWPCAYVNVLIGSCCACTSTGTC